jgi:beta-lactamase superfamily II metal-dependent hydrolase
MSELRVRVYNVRFGDAVLVTIPEKVAGHPVKRHLLFDFGNALGTEGGQDTVFEPVIDDIISELGGQPLDLYVMTHEHLDHVQGLFYSSVKLDKRITARQAWLTGSADPVYYTNHPTAKKQKLAALAAFSIARSRLRASSEASPFAGVLLANNNPRATADCITFLREKLAAAGGVHYVDRTTDLSGLQPFSTAKLTLWAPEENTADYYGKFKNLAAGLRITDATSFEDVAAAADALADKDADEAAAEQADPPRPLPGVDAGAFYNLLDVRHMNEASTMLMIDQAANNTSVVLALEWHGWRLLFPGDAEQRSWLTMNRNGAIAPIHFLKVSHHGSSNGLPPTEVLDKLLPVPAPDQRPRRSVVSTYLDTYPGVPDPPTLTEIGKRTTLTSTLDLPEGTLFVDFPFSSSGH